MNKNQNSSLANILRWVNIKYSQTVLQNRIANNISKTILWGQYLCDAKPQTSEENEIADNFEYRHKNSQYNARKPAHTKHYAHSERAYSREVDLV